MLLKKCELVQLLSGGPIMVVTSATHNYDTGLDYISVMWFDAHHHIQTATIDSDYLVNNSML